MFERMRGKSRSQGELQATTSPGPDAPAADAELSKTRPIPPPPEREWVGVLGILGLIAMIDRFSVPFPFLMRFAGLLYLLAIVYVACWAGIRAALEGSALLIFYVWLIYHVSFSPYARDPTRATGALVATAIFYPLFAVIAGVVQNKLRAAGVREYDARVAAHSELLQRRIAEAELWASEEMRRLIVDSSIDAVVGLDKLARITVWNPNAEKLFGWSQEEAIGSLATERLISPISTGRYAAELRSFFETGSAPVLRQQFEWLAATKSGTTVDVEIYVADHKTEKGPVYILFIRDISDRKRAEQAIQELNASLEERVAERTKQLEAANEELLGFTYSVSHDLRAPLRAIVSNSRIVVEEAKESLDKASVERLKRLEINALKMAELIDNLLQYARIGQVQLTSQEVDLSSMAAGIAADLIAKAGGAVAIQPGLVVDGDPEMIKMVLFNLMENAWKYVRPNVPADVEVGSTPEGAFFVRDHGIGFDMQYVNKVWEPFERLHRDSEYPGTGIGLANSKRIVERHGGAIWADSVPGKGTTMYFDLDGRTNPSGHVNAGFIS